MTDSTETTIYEAKPTTGVGYGIYTAVIAAQNDTVTLSNFNTLLDVIVIRLDNNSTCTATIATNVVTVTQDVTSEKVIIAVVGI